MLYQRKLSLTQEPVMILTCSLEQYLNFKREARHRHKKIDNEDMSESYGVIVIFPIYG